MLLLFALNKWKPKTLKPKCGPHCMAWHEEFQLERHAQSYLGLSEITVETNDDQGPDGGRLNCWSVGAHYSPFLSAQLCQPQSCCLSSCRRQTAALFLRNNLDPFPSIPMCFTLVHLSNFRVLTLSLLWSLLLATPWPILSEFSILFWCSSVLDP